MRIITTFKLSSYYDGTSSKLNPIRFPLLIKRQKNKSNVNKKLYKDKRKNNPYVIKAEYDSSQSNFQNIHENNWISNKVSTLIFGAGTGKNLYPLTRYRAEPAIPIAGHFRLVDIPISNCINSGINKISLFTQYNSRSLNNHIGKTYRNMGIYGYNRQPSVELLAAAPTKHSNSWFEGPIDAVRKYIGNLTDQRQRDIEYVLLMPGHSMVKMDYAKLIENHVMSGADITLSCKCISLENALKHTLVKLDTDYNIKDVTNKKKGIENIKEFISAPESIIDVIEDRQSIRLQMPLLASMNIYIFKKSILLDIIKDTNNNHLTSDVIPYAIKNEMKLKGYVYDGYWRELNTIESFYKANLELNEEKSKFDFYDSKSPIYTLPYQCNLTKMKDVNIDRSTVCDGCQLKRCTIINSIIGPWTQILHGTLIKDSIIMGLNADIANPGHSDINIGMNCIIKNAIIDKNTKIGDNCIIRNVEGIEHHDSDKYYIRNGIVVIPRNTVIESGTVI